MLFPRKLFIFELINKERNLNVKNLMALYLEKNLNFSFTILV